MVTTRVEVDECVDLAAAQCGNRSGGRTDSDERDILRSETALSKNVSQNRLRGRSGRCNADLLALQVGNLLVILHFFIGNQKRLLRSSALEHKGDHRLILRLHGKGVLKSARNYVGTAAHNRLKGAGAALEVHYLDIETFVFEIIQALGNG